MPRSPFDPCIPTNAAKVPDRPEWIHEIKHDGYRLMFILLGVGFRISWNHTLTDTRRELYAQVTRIENQESVVSE